VSSSSSSPSVVCPHCGKLGITIVSRDCSARGWPAVCSMCGHLSYNGSRLLRVVTMIVANSIGPLIAIALWFAGRRLWALAIVAVGVSVAFYVARWCDPLIMRPVTPAQSSKSRYLTYYGDSRIEYNLVRKTIENIGFLTKQWSPSCCLGSML